MYPVLKENDTVILDNSKLLLISYLLQNTDPDQNTNPIFDRNYAKTGIVVFDKCVTAPMTISRRQ